jgi:hypothetical protein
MLWRRRNNHDYDWQGELSARAPTSQFAIADREPDGRRQTARKFFDLVLGLVVALASLASAIKIFDPHPSGALRTVGGISALVICFYSVPTLAKRFGRWRRRMDEAEYNDVRARSILNDVWRESKDFLKRPPQRRDYDRWLSSNTKRLATLSATLANQWAEPDSGFETSGEIVSQDQLESRRKRILALYQLVAQGAYDAPKLEPHTLRSGGLDRSIAE